MAEPTHSIAETQQDPDVQRYAAAAVRLREAARRQGRMQVVLAVVIPALLVALKIAWEPATPAAVLYAIVILLVMTVGLDRMRVLALSAAARAREKYDCAVLALPWNRRIAGEEPTDEALDAVPAGKSATTPEDAVDPYPMEVDQLPLPYGRLACQSLAAMWDETAPQRYGTRLWILAGVLLAVFVAVGYVLRPTTEGALTTIVALTPVAYWIVRQQRGYREAGRLAARVSQRVESAWRNAMAETIQGAALDAVARGIQDDIFAFRAAHPVTPGWAQKRFWTTSSPAGATIERFRSDYRQLASGRS